MTDHGAAARQQNGNAASGAATPVAGEQASGNAAAETATDLARERQDGSSAQQLQEEARQVYRQSVAAEMPLNGRSLGDMFQRSERWGRDRIKEVKTAETTQVNEPLPSPAAGIPEPLPENGSTETAATTATDLAVPEPNGNAATDSANPELPDGNPAAETATDLAVRQPDAIAAADFGAVNVAPGRPTATPAATPITADGNAATVAATPELPDGNRQPVATPRAAARWPRRWPLFLLAFPAGVATWSGWVSLGGLTGFGKVHPLPGIADGFTINSAITLPIGVEAYAAYALNAWLTSAPVSDETRKFARTSAIGALVLGMLGQVAFHLLATEKKAHAPWWITTLVACLPVLVLGFGAALAHMLHRDQTE